MNEALYSNWRVELGRHWKLLLVFFALCAFAAGVTAPLADPDLPIHLATGEWVVRHHSVPFVEPWAWTRSGAPFYAYSWGIETIYFLLYRSWGPTGLQVLQGIIYVGIVGAILFLGVVARWRAWTTIGMILIQILITVGVSAFLRPQSILLLVTPVAWGLVILAAETEQIATVLVLLVLNSAVLANSHLLFPITLAPCVFLLAHPPTDRKRFLLIPCAIVLGWFITPYALHWVAIYKQNFAPNAMFGPPSPISEYRPGFTSAATLGISSVLLAIPFAFLPWVAAPRFISLERLLHGLLWLAGLLMFALATRAMVVWWLLILPMVAAVLELVPSPRNSTVRVTQIGMLVAVFAALALSGVDDVQDPWMGAGSIATRRLPSLNARSMEPIAEWLDCNVKRAVGGRLVTTFNLGGYVPWRLPYLSESIDGRTIFPDSVAKADTYFSPNRATVPLPPWRSAELAIAPIYVPVAAVLDTAKGWHRIALTSQVSGRAGLIGLWVTDKWWARAGTVALPTHVIALPHVIVRQGTNHFACGPSV